LQSKFIISLHCLAARKFYEQQMKCFFQISESGFISFETDVKTRWNIAFPSTYTFIAGYIPYDGNIGTKGTSSKITHREDTSRAILDLIERDVKASDPDSNFKANGAFIVTYSEMVNRYITFRKNTFQIVVGYNHRSAYVIANYDRLDDSGAIAGFSLKPDCNYQVFAPVTTSHRLKDTTNVRVPGRHVYLMNPIKCRDKGKFTRCCIIFLDIRSIYNIVMHIKNKLHSKLTEIYLHFIPVKFSIDLNAGAHSTLPRGDDVEKYITLSRPIPLWKGKQNGFYVSSAIF